MSKANVKEMKHKMDRLAKSIALMPFSQEILRIEKVRKAAKENNFDLQEFTDLVITFQNKEKEKKQSEQRKEEVKEVVEK